MTKVDPKAYVPQLDSVLTNQVIELLDAEPQLQFAYLFGSQAKGQSGELSDVDIAVSFVKGGDTRKLEQELFIELTRVLKSYELDLVDFAQAPITLVHQILKSGRLLVEHDHLARVRFQRDSTLRYLDTKPLRQELLSGLKRRMST